MNKNDLRRLYQLINAIPAGTVCSYGQLADLIGKPGRARWVGKMLNQSSDDISINWHRVLRSSGELAFAKFSDMAIQQKILLQQEGVVVKSWRVDMKSFQWQPSLADMLFVIEG